MVENPYNKICCLIVNWSKDRYPNHDLNAKGYKLYEIEISCIVKSVKAVAGGGRGRGCRGGSPSIKDYTLLLYCYYSTINMAPVLRRITKMNSSQNKHD
jgi:hypothetical protein